MVIDPKASVRENNAYFGLTNGGWVSDLIVIQFPIEYEFFTLKVFLELWAGTLSVYFVNPFDHNADRIINRYDRWRISKKGRFDDVICDEVDSFRLELKITYGSIFNEIKDKLESVWEKVEFFTNHEVEDIEIVPI